MNELWIRAKICEILMERDRTHYSELVVQFHSSWRKNVIEVLVMMYFENHITSSAGLIEWREDNGYKCLGSIEYLRDMITQYCVRHGCVISELSQNSFNE